MTKTIGIIAIKGGVGKTTISAALASDIVNHHDKKVLLIDANYSAPNLGLHMDIIEPDKTIHDVLSNKANIKDSIHNRFGVDVIPGSYVYNLPINKLKLKDKIKSIKNQYDYIIIDSSPSLNEEVLSTILASDSLFIVSTPDYPTLSCSLKAVNLAKQKGRPIDGIILNKIRDPAYELALKEIEEATEIPVVARIPDDKASLRAIFTRIPLSLYKKRSKFSREINKLNLAISGKKEKRSILSYFLPSLKKEEVNRQILKENFYIRKFTN